MNSAMTVTVVRCRYCVSNDEFRQMIARAERQVRVQQVRPLGNPQRQ